MLGIEITALIIGFACICISFFVSGNSKDDNIQETENTATGIWSEREEEMIRERVDELLQEKQFEIVDDATDRMNRMCNEKIMAIDEFSQPLLEKIATNHEEVVFMYNLLNEKEKEVKNTVLEPVRVMKEELVPAQTTEDSVKAPQKSPAKKVVKKQAAPKSGIETAKKKTAPAQKKQTKAEPSVEKEEVKIPGNVNLQIQKLYKEGKSVLEISKELDIGQGEVQLVIALYGGKKG